MEDAPVRGQRDEQRPPRPPTRAIFGEQAPLLAVGFELQYELIALARRGHLQRNVHLNGRYARRERRIRRPNAEAGTRVEVDRLR
jgi:hypothetical protein